MRRNAVRIALGVCLVGSSVFAHAARDVANARPNPVAVAGYCSLLFEQTSEVRRTFFIQRRNEISRSSEIGNDFALSSEGQREYQLPPAFAAEDVTLKLELQEGGPNAQAERTWALRVAPVFAPSPNKYWGREIPPNPLLTAKIVGQTEAVIEIVAKENGTIDATTVVDGHLIRADASNTLDLRLPFEMDLDFPHDNHFVDKNGLTYKVDAFLDRISKVLRRDDSTRTRRTRFTIKVKFQFSIPEDGPEIALSAEPRD